MSETSLARPSQVTVAGWVVVVASVVVVVSVFDQLGTIGSVETRASVEQFLAEPPGRGLGVGVDTVLGLLRASAYVAALCAAASAILGWFVLRRDKVARLVLTVLAVPLFLSGLTSGAFFPAVVAGSTLLLWAPAARDWFDGRAPRATSAPPAASAPPTYPPPTYPPATYPPATSPPPGAAQPPSGAGGPVPPGPGTQPAAWTGWGTSSVAAPPPIDRPGRPSPTMLLVRRPEPIFWSCLLTWAFAGIAVVGLLLSLALLLGKGSSVVAEARADTPQLSTVDVSDQALLAGVLVVVLGFLAWAVAAIVLAALVWRGRGWARITLAVSAGLAAAMGLLSLLGGQLYAVPLVIGCVVTVRLLLSRRAVEWCRRPVDPRSPTGPGGPGGPTGGPVRP